jgi:hypothetical protein
MPYRFDSHALECAALGVHALLQGLRSLITAPLLQVFEGDESAAAAGVYRRAHIASFHSNAALAPGEGGEEGDTTIAPIMHPRMLTGVTPAVPEVSIRRVPARSRG